MSESKYDGRYPEPPYPTKQEELDAMREMRPSDPMAVTVLSELSDKVARLERHQAEDRRAIRFLIEWIKKSNYGAIPGTVNEHAAAIQRAREGKS